MDFVDIITLVVRILQMISVLMRISNEIKERNNPK